MRTVYENGYALFILKDCGATTSEEAHYMTFDHNFGKYRHTSS